jgi:pSer/pThr/pTyr-binding forkhead associated (FHA) protein
MGIVTRIEDKLGDIVESPFKGKNGFDLLSIEISLKRLMELKRRNILGRVVVPTFLSVIINRKYFEEYEAFIETFKRTLTKNLDGWAKEKGYEFPNEIEFNFKEASSGEKPFDILVSYKKTNGGAANRVKEASGMAWKKYLGKVGGIIVGELVNKRTGDIFKINQNFIILGRGEDCVIRINDPTVSRKHASLSYQHGKIILEDLESKCGTWINHQRISKQIVRQGDRIMIGGMELTFLDPWRNSRKSEYDSPYDTEMNISENERCRKQNKFLES